MLPEEAIDVLYALESGRGAELRSSTKGMAVSMAVRALRSESARVMTLNEVESEEFDVYFLEIKGDVVLEFAFMDNEIWLCDDYNGDKGKREVFITSVKRTIVLDCADYGISWRCWTKMPSFDQRNAEKWGEKLDEAE